MPENKKKKNAEATSSLYDSPWAFGATELMNRPLDSTSSLRNLSTCWGASSRLCSTCGRNTTLSIQLASRRDTATPRFLGHCCMFYKQPFDATGPIIMFSMAKPLDAGASFWRSPDIRKTRLHGKFWWCPCRNAHPGRC